LENDAAFPELATQRLRLREIVMGDVPALFAIHSDADAMKWFGVDPMRTPTEAEALVETFAAWRKAPNPGTRWGLERIADGALIGSCGLFAWNRKADSCATGFELARSAWGEGYMQEALAAALAWGFTAMELNRVGAQVHPDNTHSIRLVEKLGFRREGLLREVARWNARYHDLAQYSLLRRELV
jgi:ribosomal-protein-alanine N-acetyltransferase